jgi:hypothetical protein
MKGDAGCRCRGIHSHRIRTGFFRDWSSSRTFGLGCWNRYFEDIIDEGEVHRFLPSIRTTASNDSKQRRSNNDRPHQFATPPILDHPADPQPRGFVLCWMS